jgi:hypothetical protein
MLSYIFGSSYTEPVIIVIACCMVAFLWFGARYDAHGTMVPDDATVPYAFLGLIAAAYRGRWISFALGLIVLLLALFGKQPKWMKKLGEKMVMRAYKSEEAVEEVSEEQAAKAEEFEQKHGVVLHAKMAYLIGGMGGVFVAYPVIMFIYSKTGEIEFGSWLDILRIGISLVLWITCGFIVYQSHVGEQSDEEVCAFGGADMLILIGLFGFYGGVAFLYALIPTFAVYLLYFILAHFIKREKTWGGRPMLPVLFCTIPVRVYVVCYLAYNIIVSYEDMFEWVLLMLGVM